MGGFGSGRGTGRSLIEACRSLDIRQLHRAACLATGWYGDWHWRDQHGRSGGTVAMVAGRDSLILIYCIRLNGGPWRSVRQVTQVAWTACHFGGARPWFICPGTTDRCLRRVAKLYASDHLFLCRGCHRLAYAVERQSRWDRAYRRLAKARLRLEAAPLGRDEPPRPKGMHRKTFRRLQEKLRTAQLRHDDEYRVMLVSLLKRSGGIPPAC